jgi:hypothetical protein
MKNSALVVILMLTGMLSLRAGQPTAFFHTDNIVLKTFQVVQVTGGAKAMWEFTSEEKDVICNLERSTDGVAFTRILTIHLSSTREQALHSYIDKEATGHSFYRLRVTKETYIPYISPIVSITLPGRSLDNQQQGMIPVQSRSIFGDLSAQESMVSVRLLDLYGQSRMRQNMKGTELENNFRISFTNVPAGYYVLRVNDQQNKTLLNKLIYKF